MFATEADAIPREATLSVSHGEFDIDEMDASGTATVVRVEESIPDRIPSVPMKMVDEDELATSREDSVEDRLDEDSTDIATVDEEGIVNDDVSSDDRVLESVV